MNTLTILLLVLALIGSRAVASCRATITLTHSTSMSNVEEIVFEDHPTHKLFQDLTGMDFGKVSVLGFAGQGGKSKLWYCKCECGSLFIAHACNLKSGKTKSCGCERNRISKERATKHGMSKGPIANVLNSMKMRCHNPNTKAYKDYGARGIGVCDRWRFGESGKTAVECFIEDMGPRPEGATIERKRNNDGYSKDNCIWATRVQQGRNKRNNLRLKFDGRSLTISEWSEKLGISKKTLNSRFYNYKWSVEKTLAEPVRNWL